MVLLETWCAWFSSMPTTLVVTLFIISIWKVICESKETQESIAENMTLKKGNKIFTYCGIICLTTFWFRSTIQSIVFTVLIAEDRNEEKVAASLSFSWLFYGSGLWLMMVSFVLRIQYTFKNTYLEYSTTIIKILYIILGLLFIEVILVVITNNVDSLYEESLIISYVALISHFLFSILLTYLLFNKIFVTMQYRLREKLGSVVYETVEIETGGAAAVNDVAHDAHDSIAIGQQEQQQVISTENVIGSVRQRNRNQISLNTIKEVTRYALLMFVGIISTYIVSILVFIDIEYGWSISYHMLTYGQALIGFDLLVNATAVYLLFEHNSKIYFRACKICHVGCERCCVQVIYLYSKTSKSGINSSSGKNRQEFATLILTADDDNVVI